jgi:hypothetical protein
MHGGDFFSTSAAVLSNRKIHLVKDLVFFQMVWEVSPSIIGGSQNKSKDWVTCTGKAKGSCWLPASRIRCTEKALAGCAGPVSMTAPRLGPPAMSDAGLLGTITTLDGTLSVPMLHRLEACWGRPIGVPACHKNETQYQSKWAKPYPLKF